MTVLVIGAGVIGAAVAEELASRGERVTALATENHLPVIGPHPSDPRTCVATGHDRNGILLAPLTAQIVADHVVD